MHAYLPVLGVLKYILEKHILPVDSLVWVLWEYALPIEIL